MKDSPSTPPGRPTRPRPGARAHKRDAITRAARVVFGRDGYSRAGIDAIAAEAGVSTRTIYNHFEGKEQLFHSVLEESAAQVADAFVADVARRLDGPSELERDLIELGHALAEQSSGFPEHFAMVRQINAEESHFPEATIRAWLQAGPDRVQHEVERRLERLAEQGLLRVADPSRAAAHFVVLATAEITPRPYAARAPLSDERRTEAIRAGVRAFLHGYAAPQ